MRRILKASALLAAVTLVAVTGAGAATSPSYQVAGIEIGATQATVSPFTGLGVGSTGDRGFWQANVTHVALDTCTAVGSSCAITGGTFTLRTNGSQLNGSFTGGTFQVTSPSLVAGVSSSPSPAISRRARPDDPHRDGHQLPVPVPRTVRCARLVGPGIARTRCAAGGGGGQL